MYEVIDPRRYCMVSLSRIKLTPTVVDAGWQRTFASNDGVKTRNWPIVREGTLVGLQTNREAARWVLTRKTMVGAAFD